MTAEKLYGIIGDIDENIIAEADSYRRKRQFRITGLAAAAACIALVMLGGFISFAPDNAEKAGTAVTQTTESGSVSYAYVYRVSSGEFASYMGGKVIEKEKLGESIDTVNVDAGWYYGDGTRDTEETLRAEVYTINGIEKETAVALKFLDKGDALTTDHYYVIINPRGNVEAVREYYISPVIPRLFEYVPDIAPLPAIPPPAQNGTVTMTTSVKLK